MTEGQPKGNEQGDEKRRLSPKTTPRMNPRSPEARRLITVADEWREKNGMIVAAAGRLRKFADHVNALPEFSRYHATPECWYGRLREAEAALAMDREPDITEQRKWARLIHALPKENGGTFKTIESRTSISMTRLLNLSRNLARIEIADMHAIGAAFGLSREEVDRRCGIKVPVTITKPATSEQTVLPLATQRPAVSGALAEVAAVICDLAERRSGMAANEVLLLAHTIDPARFGARALIAQRVEREGSKPA